MVDALVLLDPDPRAPPESLRRKAQRRSTSSGTSILTAQKPSLLTPRRLGMLWHVVRRPGIEGPVRGAPLRSRCDPQATAVFKAVEYSVTSL